jgi:phosphohistidine phosphatase
MSLLLLLRHAKAGWAEPGVTDFDRPLDKTGQLQAAATGDTLRDKGFRPDLILCSPSRRTLETLQGLATAVDMRNARLVESLYSGDANAYLQAIRAAGGAETALLIGHNPMMENIGVALSGQGSEAAMAALRHGFPTSGLAVVRLPGSLQDAAPGQGYLEDFVVPPSF